MLGQVWIWLALGPPIQRPSEGVPLRWSAPLECPDQTALRERVHALVPGLLERRDAAGSQVEAEVRARDRSYAAVVVVRNSDGETRREFAADDCELVADAVALILAVALDPVSASVGVGWSDSSVSEPSWLHARGTGLRMVEPEPLDAEPLKPEPSEPEPASPSSSEPGELGLTLDADLADDDRSRRFGFGVRVFGGGGYGPTNTGYATIGGTLALIGPRWRAELGGLWAIPRTVRAEAGIGGTFDGWAVLGRGCFVPKVRRLELPVCGGVELGSVRGRGLPDLPISDQASFLWVAIAAAQGLWFRPIDRVGIGVELNMAVPLNRGSFMIESDEIQRIAAVTVRGLGGVELRW